MENTRLLPIANAPRRLALLCLLAVMGVMSPVRAEETDGVTTPAIQVGDDNLPAELAAMPAATDTMDESELSAVRGRGAETATPEAGNGVAVILWDEPGCSGCRIPQAQAQATGNGNLQKTSLTQSRP